MSKKFYENSMEHLSKIIDGSYYEKIILDLRDGFMKTHISITDIDKEKDKLLGYYYEKVLITPMPDYDNQTILDVIYKDGNINYSLYDYLRSKELSIFKIKNIKKDFFVLVDILKSKKKAIKVPLDYYWIGAEKGELIQGFLYQGEYTYLSDYSFIHPKGVEKYILKEVKNHFKYEKGVSFDDFLAQLFRKYVNSMRYSGKEPSYIYCLDL